MTAGSGFESGGEYYCRFQEFVGDKRFVWSLADVVRPFKEDGGQRRRVLSNFFKRRSDADISQSSDHWSYSDMPQGGLVCELPPWPFSAQRVKFSVAASLYGPEIPSNGEARQSNFTYLEGWDSSTAARHSPASGGTALRMSSCGLDATGSVSYSCKWERQIEGAPIQSLSSSVIIVNETSFSCETPQWGAQYSANNVSMTVSRGSTLLDDVAAGASAAAVVFEFYTVWVDWPRRPAVSPNGGVPLSLAGFGFSQADLCFCRFSRDHLIADSNLTSAESPVLLTCDTPAWHAGSQIVLVSLFCTPLGGLQPMAVPVVDGRESVSILYASAWGNMSLEGGGTRGLASGHEMLDIVGSGFLPGAAYECVFTSLHNSSVSKRTKATVRSAAHLQCLTPAWGIADTVFLAVDSTLACDEVCQRACTGCFNGSTTGPRQECIRQCLLGNGASTDELEMALAPVFPPGDTAKTLFHFIAAWSRMTLSCGGSKGPASGGQHLNIAGSGFDSDAAYKCVFASLNDAVILRTNATVVNSTHVFCRTPAWVAQETVRFDMELDMTPLHFDKGCGDQCASNCTKRCMLVDGYYLREPQSAMYKSMVDECKRTCPGFAEDDLPCNRTGCFYAFFSYWQTLAMPALTFKNQPALLTAGGDSIHLHGVAFSKDLQPNCTFWSANGTELPSCHVPANVLSTTHILCITRQCIASTRRVTLYVSGLHSVDPTYAGPADADCLPYMLGAPAKEAQLVGSWDSLQTDASAVALAQGGSFVQIRGPGLNLDDYNYNCTYLDYHSQVLGASVAAMPNASQGLSCAFPR